MLLKLLSIGLTKIWFDYDYYNMFSVQIWEMSFTFLQKHKSFVSNFILNQCTLDKVQWLYKGNIFQTDKINLIFLIEYNFEKEKKNLFIHIFFNFIPQGS